MHMLFALQAAQALVWVISTRAVSPEILKTTPVCRIPSSIVLELADPPFVRVEIIEPVAHILGKTKRHAFVGQEY